jgi:ribosomal protein S12 methylthiotransferase
MLYLHPDKFPPRLPALVASDARLLPYFDVPFQHADAAVLRRMGRAGDGERYLDLIGAVRDAVPDAVIRSTFLVGHPGEGRREFDALLRFQERARLDWLGAFAWSREEGTPAAGDKGALAAAIAAPAARRRREAVEGRQRAITEARLDRWIGREMDVLVEERVEGEALALGRAFPQAPEVDGSVVIHSPSAAPGDVVRCRMAGRAGLDLQAVPVESGGAR